MCDQFGLANLMLSNNLLHTIRSHIRRSVTESNQKNTCDHNLIKMLCPVHTSYGFKVNRYAEVYLWLGPVSVMQHGVSRYWLPSDIYDTLRQQNISCLNICKVKRACYCCQVCLLLAGNSASIYIYIYYHRGCQLVIMEYESLHTVSTGSVSWLLWALMRVH